MSTPTPEDGSERSTDSDIPRVATATRDVAASASTIFALLADPARHPEIDSMDNLVDGTAGHRIRAVGDVFPVTLTTGGVRENHVVEFVENRRIAWRPAEPGQPPIGHLWRWEVEPIGDAVSRVTLTYD